MHSSAEWLLDEGLSLKKQTNCNNSHTPFIPGGKLLKCVSFSRWNEDSDKKNCRHVKCGTDAMSQHRQQLIQVTNTRGYTGGFQVTLQPWKKKKKKTKNVSCVFCGTSQVPQTQHGGYFVKLHLLLLLLLSVSLQLTFLVPEEEGLLCWVWPLEGGVVIVLHTAGQVRSPTLCHRHILNQRVLTADACGHDTWEEKRVREDEDVSGRKSERRRGRREWGRWCVFDCLICEVARLIKKRLIHSNSVRGWSKIQTIKPDYKVMWWRCD